MYVYVGIYVKYYYLAILLHKRGLEILVFTLQISKSSSNLQEITYGGRPKGEEPHVKRSVKRKQEHIEYIVRVDLVSL